MSGVSSLYLINGHPELASYPVSLPGPSVNSSVNKLWAYEGVFSAEAGAI